MRGQARVIGNLYKHADGRLVLPRLFDHLRFSWGKCRRHSNVSESRKRQSADDEFGPPHVIFSAPTVRDIHAARVLLELRNDRTVFNAWTERGRELMRQEIRSTPNAVPVGLGEAMAHDASNRTTVRERRPPRVVACHHTVDVV